MKSSTWRRSAARVMGAVVGVLVLSAGVAATGITPTARLLDTAATRTSRQPTTVTRVSPVTANGGLRPGYVVQHSGRGHCWTTSFVHGRAYRCFQGNRIMDPCWKASTNSVVCLLLPWSSKVTRLRLTKRLPSTGTYGGRLWGLRLGAGVGANCLVSTGAGGFIGDRHISYYCSGDWVLLGAPNRAQAVWTIATARRVGGHYELRGRKPLTTAWKPRVP